MIEEINNQISEFKNVVGVLPVTSKANKKRKISCIEEEETKTNQLVSDVVKEIESRFAYFNNLSLNPQIKKLEEELEKCNIINEWNNYNTPYEKMHLDYFLYQLHRYYKNDLNSVNECIKKIIESFAKVEVNITSEDFEFNNYAREYIEAILNNISPEELTNKFESLYWKNPDIIKTIEISFKSIYLKYEKKIQKYYENRHNEFLKSHKDSEIYDLRVNLYYKINELKSIDPYLNYQKFLNGDYKTTTFKDMDKKKNQYFTEESYSKSNLDKLISVLKEYKVLIEYKYLLDDMKEKLDKKDTLKDNKSNLLKKISKEEAKLVKLSSKQNKKGLLGKGKNDDKLLFEYKGILNNIFDFYKEYDGACFDDLVYTKLTKDSSILECLQLLCSNYLYFINTSLKQDENSDINIISDNYEKLKEYINFNNFYLINNIALLDEKQMKQLIVDKYNLEHINISIEDLVPESIDNTIENINNLIINEDIITSGINVDDIELYLEYKKINP